MRSLLVLALAGCSSSPPVVPSPPAVKPPTTLVVYDRLLERELNRADLATLEGTAPAFTGCTMRAVNGHATIQCEEKDVYLRFSCADHPTGRPLELMFDRVSYALHCE